MSLLAAGGNSVAFITKSYSFKLWVSPPSAGLPAVPTQACPWTALPLAMTMTLRGVARESQVRKLRRENMGLNIKEGSAAQSMVIAPVYQGHMYTVLPI